MGTRGTAEELGKLDLGTRGATAPTLAEAESGVEVKAVVEVEAAVGVEGVIELAAGRGTSAPRSEREPERRG